MKEKSTYNQFLDKFDAKESKQGTLFGFKGKDNGSLQKVEKVKRKTDKDQIEEFELYKLQNQHKYPVKPKLPEEDFAVS